MTAIDTNGMNLSYQTKSGPSTVRVEFDPPLAGYAEVKPRLIGMKADAEEALGMMKAPQIKTYEPTRSWLTGAGIVGFIIYVTLAPPPAANVPAYWIPGTALRDAVGGTRTMKGVWAFLLVAHFFEALYTLLLVRRHRCGFALGTLYVLTTFVFGQPVWSGFRRQVQAARIDSIMKGQ